MELELALEALERNDATIGRLEQFIRKDDTADSRAINIEEYDFKKAQRVTQTYTEKQWYLKNKFIDPSGRVQIDKIAMHINELLQDKNWFEAYTEWEKFWQKEKTNYADTHAKSGGDSISPKMFTTSFPGVWRGDLFHALQVMHLKLGKEGDVHVMNNNKRSAGGSLVDLPGLWEELFAEIPCWVDFKNHLVKFDDTGTKPSTKLCPEWFVEHWAPAAIHVAQHNAEYGTGIIMFTWPGYYNSKNCELEFLFCRTLALKYPDSVYIVARKNNKFIGSFMKGTESYNEESAKEV